MKTITSTANDQIKHMCHLHEAKGRSTHKEFIAEGLRTCTTLIKNGMQPLQLYVEQVHLEAALHLVAESLVTLVTAPVMKKMSTTDTPSGIVGLFKIPATPSLSTLGPGLVLAQINDPGNMGTLIRSAVAFGIKNIVVCEGADVWHPKVVRASAGYHASVTIFSISWQTLVTWKKDLQLHALVVKGGKRPDEISAAHALLVVGNEAHGIPAPWLRDCDAFITVAMPGNTESLNAAVAGSLALYLTFVDKC